MGPGLGVAVADEGLDLRRVEVVAGQVEGSGEEVDVGAGNLPGLERGGPGGVPEVAQGTVVGVVREGREEELGAPLGVDVSVARVDDEVSDREHDGGRGILVVGILPDVIVGNGGDRVVGEVVGVVPAAGGRVEHGVSVEAFGADQLDLELLVGVLDEEAAVEEDRAAVGGLGGVEVVVGAEAGVGGLVVVPLVDGNEFDPDGSGGGIGDADVDAVGDERHLDPLLAQQREPGRAEVGGPAGGELRIERERGIVGAPVFGLVLVEDGGPEIVFPAVLAAVGVGVGDGRIGAGAVAADVQVRAGEDARVAVGDPVRGLVDVQRNLGRRLLEAAELEDVGEEGLGRGRADAGERAVDAAVGGHELDVLADMRAVVDVVAGERVEERADLVHGVLVGDDVRVAGPGVVDLLVARGGDAVVVGRVVLVVEGAAGVGRSGGSVEALRDGDGERLPFEEGVRRAILAAVQIPVLPDVGEAVLVEVAEVVDARAGALVPEVLVGIRGEVADRGGAAGLRRLDQDGRGAGIGDVEVGGRGGEGGLVVGELPAEGIGPGGEDGLDHRGSGGVEVVSVHFVPRLGRVVLPGRARVDDEIGHPVSAAGHNGGERADVGEEKAAGIGDFDDEVAGLRAAAVIVGRIDADLLAFGMDRDGRVGRGVGRTRPVVDQVLVVVRRDVGGDGGERERRAGEGLDHGCRLGIVVRGVEDRIDVVDRPLEDGRAEVAVRIGRGDREVVVAVEGVDAERARRGVAGNRDRGRNGHVVGGGSGAVERQLKDDVRGGRGAERDIDAVRGDSLVDVHHVGGEENPILHVVAKNLNGEGDRGSRIGVSADRDGDRGVSRFHGHQIEGGRILSVNP